MRAYSNCHLIEEKPEAQAGDWLTTPWLHSDSGERHPQDHHLLFSCPTGLLGMGGGNGLSGQPPSWLIQGHCPDSIWSEGRKGRGTSPTVPALGSSGSSCTSHLKPSKVPDWYDPHLCLHRTNPRQRGSQLVWRWQLGLSLEPVSPRHQDPFRRLRQYGRLAAGVGRSQSSVVPLQRQFFALFCTVHLILDKRDLRKDERRKAGHLGAGTLVQW